MAETQTLTIRIQPAMSERLDALASHTGRTATELAEEALKAYLAVQDWQVAAIEEAIRDVEAGVPLIEHAAVVAWMESWGTENELPRPG